MKGATVIRQGGVASSNSIGDLQQLKGRDSTTSLHCDGGESNERIHPEWVSEHIETQHGSTFSLHFLLFLLPSDHPTRTHLSSFRRNDEMESVLEHNELGRFNVHVEISPLHRPCVESGTDPVIGIVV
ncbi:hypothetical protein PENTCL1PPCAC_12800 [Pristionchus entomophagus]|uniref:Uncharacterized protein n=1 Tax=Pristionchus entomophagus TaxID=358040 RepID=A0AAV5T686_9BILA|nr:hypothetical protein PENTCL1PPCAC_12800 [Pristionchus entomophagus]